MVVDKVEDSIKISRMVVVVGVATVPNRVDITISGKIRDQEEVAITIPEEEVVVAEEMAMAHVAEEAVVVAVVTEGTREDVVATMQDLATRYNLLRC